MPASPAFDPAAYPRTYRMRRGWRILALATGAGFMVGGGELLAAAVAGRAGPAAGRAGLAACGIAVLLFGAALVADTLRSKVVLTADAIENHGLHRTIRARRDELAGRRLVRAGRTPTLVLERRGPGARPLRLPLVVNVDAAFEAWLGTIPDLDAGPARPPPR